jgi:hypothetical protein
MSGFWGDCCAADVKGAFGVMKIAFRAYRHAWNLP